MKKNLFISGSMTIIKLSIVVEKTLEKIFNEKKYNILIGDAKGVDTLIQKTAINKSFFDVNVFSILRNPRNFLSQNFIFEYIKSIEKIPRKKQQEKDIVMTERSDALLVLWDGKSKGSYDNILRGLKLKKHIEVFCKNRFLTSSEITKENIEKIFSENYEYSASEIIKKRIFPEIKTVQDFQKILFEKSILTVKDNEIFPEKSFQNKISVTFSRGRKILKYKKSLLEKVLPQNIPFPLF